MAKRVPRGRCFRLPNIILIYFILVVMAWQASFRHSFPRRGRARKGAAAPQARQTGMPGPPSVQRIFFCTMKYVYGRRPFPKKRAAAGGVWLYFFCFSFVYLRFTGTSSM